MTDATEESILFLKNVDVSLWHSPGGNQKSTIGAVSERNNASIVPGITIKRRKQLFGDGGRRCQGVHPLSGNGMNIIRQFLDSWAQ